MQGAAGDNPYSGKDVFEPRGAPAPCARQIEVAEMSNELVAIAKLLDLLAIEGAIVSIDAIGCHAR